MAADTGPILALAGGVGGAKLALGLARTLPPNRLVIIVNTGDDQLFHGLHVAPDLDTVMYTLSGRANPDTGWGLAGETFHALAMLSDYGAPTWFNLGDMDLATHVRRTQLLREGWTLSEAMAELCRRLGISPTVAPMSDDPSPTLVDTDDGLLTFQEYFVRRRCEPRARAVEYPGAGAARPSPSFARALDAASALVFCPSNPFLSIDPILSVGDARRRVREFGGPKIMVSPIVGGDALRGPAAKLMRELGHPATAAAVAERYRDVCDHFVMDRVDAAEGPAVAALGMTPHFTETVMTTTQDKEDLARYVVRLAEGRGG